MVLFFINQIFQFSQSLPDKPKFATNNEQNFVKTDNLFNSVQITHGKKNIVYQYLAAILHLSNIEFGSNAPDDPTDHAYIIDTTEHHVEISANLLNISADELKKVLLFNPVNILGATIRFIDFLNN